MKSPHFSAILIFLMFAACPAIAGLPMVETASAPPPPEPWWSGSLSAGWDSEYMFRGVDILDGTSLQWTAVEGSAFGFKAGAWFANGVDRDYSELDLYLGYNRSLGPLEVEVGYIYYVFPKDNQDTNEFYGGISYQGFKWIVPSLYYFQDVDLFDGGYLQLKVEGNFPLFGDKVALAPYVSVSAGDYNTGADWEWNNFQVGVSVSAAITEHLTLTGYGAYSRALDAVENIPGTDRDEFWGGASVSVGF